MPLLLAFLYVPDDAWLRLVLPAAVLTLFVSTIAYIHNPRLKTLVFSMPVPFTCAYLSTAMKIQPTHMTGIIFVASYHWIVWTIYRKLRLPLGVGIAVGVAFYLTCAATTAWLFRHQGWEPPMNWMIGLVFLLWAIGCWLYRPIHEPGHRSTAPWYVKIPIVFPIAIVLFSLKELLRGAVTTFPYAGVFTSYEMRHSPRTLAGQYTINNISFILMFVVMWKLEPHGRAIALLGGWAVVLSMLTMIYRFGFGRPAGPPPEPIPAGE